jgi:RNA polymerase subunit RPABC4/transcription elongation factor Spt4
MELAQASVGIASAQGSANIPTTTDAKSPGTRREEDQLVSNDNLGDLLSMHLQGEASIPQGERATKEQCLKANPTCPFSHDSMDSSVSISLRCGHRFALSHMEIARSGPSVCASAGFASKDALICPLCGDQDVTTTPEGSSMITTYSTNTAAYLGELKKDWQWNLLPMQDPITSMPKDSGEESRKGRSFLPSILSARKA